MDCSIRFLCPWDYPGKNTGVGCHAIPGDLLNPGIKPRSFALQADSLPSEPPGKPKNTGMSSLSLLQGIFLTQELNQGLLHCRQILYLLNYQGRQYRAIQSSVFFQWVWIKLLRLILAVFLH